MSRQPSVLLIGIVLATMSVSALAGQREEVMLSNGILQVSLTPERGGKINSLVYLPANRELVSQRAVQPATLTYGMPFDQTEMDGIDECFPSVGPCVYPDGPWAGVEIPDHGEVFCSPWVCQASPDAITCQVGGVRLPWTFERTVRLRDHTLQLDYSIRNNSGFPLKYLYCTHPLMAATPGLRIVPPAGTKCVVGGSQGDVLGPAHTVFDWKSPPVALDTFGPADQPWSAKVYLIDMSEPRIDCVYPDGLRLRWTWDGQVLPAAGLWINQGVVPAGELQYAIEPSNAPRETLAQADEAGMLEPVPPYGTVSWSIEIAVLAP